MDNDSDSRDLLALLFDEFGVETITATCVSESLAILQQTQPDLVISEIALPDEDGYSLISKVKTFETVHQVQIPAIALTVYARESDRIQALAAGFCRHLSKPLDLDKLIATVACVTGDVQEIAVNACN
ncbi:MAG: hypothetical protein Kow00121_52080 [Elainellaceae cyanobacterium]